MPKTRIIIIFIIIDLAIVGAVVWSAFHAIPLRQYLIPAVVLLSLNALLLVWMTLRHTPPRE